MGLQSIVITLEELSSTAVARSTRGLVCLILDDPNITGVKTYTGLKKVTDSYSTGNMAIITRCFSNYGVNKLVVACYNSKATPAQTVSNALTNLNNVRFNYLACPTVTSQAEQTLVVTFIKAQRNASNILVKSVLNNDAADYEGVVNFANTSITMNSTQYTGQAFCVDVACKLAVCPLDSSITNDTISGVSAVDTVGSDLDALVDAGKLFLYYDYDLNNIVFSRGVNSKVTIGSNEKGELKKIRIIDTLDMVRDDMKLAWKSNYQGKVVNSLANKKLLVSAYNAYLRNLVTEGVLSDSNTSYVWLDVAATKSYAEDTLSMDCSAMTDEEILNIDTGSFVFIKGVLYPLDAMEDLELVLQYN